MASNLADIVFENREGMGSGLYKTLMEFAAGQKREEDANQPVLAWVDYVHHSLSVTERLPLGIVSTRKRKLVQVKHLEHHRDTGEQFERHSVLVTNKNKRPLMSVGNTYDVKHINQKVCVSIHNDDFDFNTEMFKRQAIPFIDSVTILKIEPFNQRATEAEVEAEGVPPQPQPGFVLLHCLFGYDAGANTRDATAYTCAVYSLEEARVPRGGWSNQGYVEVYRRMWFAPDSSQVSMASRHLTAGNRAET